MPAHCFSPEHRDSACTSYFWIYMLKLQSPCLSFSTQALSQKLSKVIVGKDDMEHSGQGTEQPEPKCWGQTVLTNKRGFQPRAAFCSSGSALGFLPDLLLLAKNQQQQLHMLPLFSEWARIKGEVLKQAMCVPRLSCYL